MKNKKGNKTKAEKQNEKQDGEVLKSCQLDSIFFLFSPSFLVLAPIRMVGVQLKATNSEVLILARKEDKDK